MATDDGLRGGPAHERTGSQDQPILVQTLTRRDVGAMRAMMKMFAAAFGDAARYTAKPPDDLYLERLLASDAFVAVAAFAGSKVVGGIAAYALPKFEQVRTELYIYDLAVDATHRRRGVATSMIAELKRVAVARGAYVIFVQADPGDDAAIALYTSLGVREDVLHFDIAPS